MTKPGGSPAASGMPAFYLGLFMLDGDAVNAELAVLAADGKPILCPECKYALCQCEALKMCIPWEDFHYPR